jgi:hypothetical protein
MPTPDGKLKILAGTNVLTNVESPSYDNHIDLFYKIGQGGKYFIYRGAPHRMSIDHMRNYWANSALLLECDYLWFIDDDSLLKYSTLDSLVDACENHGYDIVMADTCIRGYPFHRMSFKIKNISDENTFDLDHYDDVMDDIDEFGLSKSCVAVGFHCCLIRVELLKKVSKPYFVTSSTHTEDIYFCIKCRQEIDGGVKVAVDTRVPTLHRLDALYVGPENCKKMKEFYEQTSPYVPKNDPELEYRADNYHEMVEKA